jgi:hypothetical protein
MVELNVLDMQVAIHTRACTGKLQLARAAPRQRGALQHDRGVLQRRKAAPSN